MFHNKFVSEQRNYTMACLVNFAECKMKQKCTPDNRISEILDFYSKPQKITEDVEYSKSGRESTQSKPNTSNFANAHIF